MSRKMVFRYKLAVLSVAFLVAGAAGAAPHVEPPAAQGSVGPNDGYILVSKAGKYSDRLIPLFCPDDNGYWEESGCGEHAAPPAAAQTILDIKFGKQQAVVTNIAPFSRTEAVIYYRKVR